MKRTIIMAIAAFMTFSICDASASCVDMKEPSSIFDKSSKKKAEIKEVVFHVHLHCGSCVKKVQENIAFEKGVKDLKVSLDDQTVTIKYDAAKTSEQTLKAALAKLGFPVGGHGHNHK